MSAVGRVGRLLTALSLITTLGACGFHLAGTQPLSPALSRVRIDVVAPYRVSEPPVETSLRTRLQRRGAEVVESSGGDVTLIRLSDLVEMREVLSIGSDGKALEFLLTTRVDYTVSRGDRVVLPQTRISVSRDYSFDQEQVLAKEAEEDRLRRYMQAELAELMLRQLDARLEHPGAAMPQASRVDGS